ncbi:hypothetical protein ACQVP2_07805 [Methylobacterium aquaticum]|jgi:hypothetical protein|uniref:Uncharacterized protein n=1 Tax=Methylobacterium aquaticum TaxID=270351 RepID=A0A0J6SG89_9HYPH|nr:hypothetical protein [Methylobacterium aquaticum]KMO32717.1 hypothetical protein VP06_17070 [Methylobacterium aquaticum]
MARHRVGAVLIGWFAGPVKTFLRASHDGPATGDDDGSDRGDAPIGGKVSAGWRPAAPFSLTGREV